MGDETTVRRIILEFHVNSHEAFIPLEFLPGVSKQIYWGKATVYHDGVKAQVNLFCAKLCYSEYPIVIA